MYKAVTDEIDAINQKILDSWQQNGQLEIEKPTDYIDMSEKKLYTIYANTNRSIQFSGDISDFIKNKCLYHFAAFDSSMPCLVKLSSLPDEWQKLAKTVYDAYSKNGVQPGDIQNMLLKICKSSPTEVCPVTDPLLGEIIEELYTPEDKLLAGDILFALLAEAYNAGKNANENNTDTQDGEDSEGNEGQDAAGQNADMASTSENNSEGNDSADDASENASEGSDAEQDTNTKQNSDQKEKKQGSGSDLGEMPAKMPDVGQDNGKQDKAEPSKQTWREKVRNGLINNGYSKDDVRTILSKVNAKKIKN